MTTGPQLNQPAHPLRQDAGAEVVLHEERLSVQVDRVAVERVVLRRRIVTEVRQVEVTVRREELEIHRAPASGQETAQSGPPPHPLVIVLSEEVPVVELATRAYERVVVYVDTSTTQQQVTADVSREQVDLSRTRTPH
jgi:uncharacterized protein (TIGR02271 family)